MHQELLYALKKLFQLPLDNATVHPIGGGSINEAWRIDIGKERWFVKSNRTAKFPRMFEFEAKGLDLLRKETGFEIPKTLGLSDDGTHSYLILEHIEETPKTPLFWERFGMKLAGMHRVTGDQFGLGYDNYIGSLPQQNHHCANWATFFSEMRLMPLAHRAMQHNLITPSDLSDLERMCSRLNQFFPREEPSLLHGDLWNGNMMCVSDQQVALFDPAVYFGHRMMDIAMMHLFGGFDTRVFHVYQTHFPFEGNWNETIDVCNLYPLMAHLNLFGKGYLAQIRDSLRRYS